MIGDPYADAKTSLPVKEIGKTVAKSVTALTSRDRQRRRLETTACISEGGIDCIVDNGLGQISDNWEA